VITTAPKAKPKPYVQTEFMLAAMADTVKREEERWVKMQVSIDILASMVDSQGETQQQMPVQMDITTQALTQSVKDRLTLAQQLVATSDMVAHLVADRCQDGGREGPSARSGFFRGHQQEGAPVPPNRLTLGCNHGEDENLPPHPALSKMSFPKFHGEHPHIWLDKCVDYFCIFNIPECLWSTTASIHMEDNAAKWMQVYKMKRGLGDWQEFARAVDEKFGVFDYRRSLQDLLLLKQMGSVEEYTKEFEALQFQVTMFNPGLNDMFFTTHFVNGLKEEIKGTVQSQIPYSVDRASMLARISNRFLIGPSSNLTRLAQARCS
jgi:hypothetical protein